MLIKVSFVRSRVVCVVVVLCISFLTFSGNAVAATKVLKLAHQWTAPQNGKGDDRSVAAAKFARYVDQYSKGSLKIQVYPGNSLIPPKQQWDALTSGALDMAVIVPTYFSGRVSELRGFIMMGLLRSSDAAFKFEQGAGGKVIKNLFKDNGVRLLVWLWQPLTAGFRDKKVTTPSELKGLRMRGPGPAIEKIYANHGAGVVSMPSSDLYTALQTGALDGAITSFSSIHSYKLYENLKYIAESPSNGGLVYALAPLVMSNSVWKQLDKQQQQAIQKAAHKLQPWAQQHTKTEATKNIKIFKQHGAGVYKLTPSQFQAWMTAAKPVVDSYADISPAAAKIVKYARKANKNVAK